MKKSNLNKVFTGLLAFMLAIFSFTFIACSDGDVRVYPTGRTEEASSFNQYHWNAPL